MTARPARTDAVKRTRRETRPRARDPERRVVTHSRPPTSRARPSRVTSSAGIRSASTCATAASSPARKRASPAPRPRQRCGRRPSLGGDPTPPVPRSRGRSGGGSSRQRSSNAAGRSRSSRDLPAVTPRVRAPAGLDRNRPVPGGRNARDGEIAARVHEARAERGEQREDDRPRSPFPIPPRSSRTPGSKRDEETVYVHASARRHGPRIHGLARDTASKVRSYPAATRARARWDRTAHRFGCARRAPAPRPREAPGSARSIRSRSGGRARSSDRSARMPSRRRNSRSTDTKALTVSASGSVEEGLDVRPHRPEPVSFHHDVWVLVTGGVETIPQDFDGGAGADQDEFDGAAVAAAAVAAACALADSIAAIWRLRLFSSTR